MKICSSASDRRNRREAGPEEERGARVVLQPAPEAEAHEVRRAGQHGNAVRKRRLGAAPSTVTTVCSHATTHGRARRGPSPGRGASSRWRRRWRGIPTPPSPPGTPYMSLLSLDGIPASKGNLGGILTEIQILKRDGNTSSKKYYVFCLHQ